MTLRARLVAILAALITVGLLVSGVLTYGTLDKYLFDRVDVQLQNAQPEAIRYFSSIFSEPQSDGRPPHAPDNLPIAVYAEVLDPAGKVLDRVAFGFPGGQTVYTPAIPASLSASHSGLPFTARSQESESYKYRVLATPLPTGATLIVAIPLAETQATLNRLLLIEGIVALAILAAISLTAWALIRREFAPLDRMTETATEIAGGTLSRRVDEPNAKTEVGRLGGALNMMLERIEQAFEGRRASEERMRRFLADASHELRTPLTSIRGYAELFRRGAAERPEDLALSMRRIEDEAARMGILVEELLLLAHVDQTRPMKEVEVDLSALVADSVEDARARDWQRSLETKIEDGIVVMGDGDRLLEAIGNLIENAFVHTPPGSPVVIELQREGTDAVLTVADSGPGLSDEALAHAFDRFWRGDPSRSRHSGGAGLGLAIVAAVARAHGGSVSAVNRAEGGACFTLRVPFMVRDEVTSAS
ncbi:MAG: two-component system, OmpR family, sensor kinase [Actinomycetota bacterium]|jgi:two-component system OmpR family sensor kinase|nr:two-component system, OmpR family, sensor kinase [Actinomycetota bacterium]